MKTAGQRYWLRRSELPSPASQGNPAAASHDRAAAAASTRFQPGFNADGRTSSKRRNPPGDVNAREARGVAAGSISQTPASRRTGRGHALGYGARGPHGIDQGEPRHGDFWV